MGCDGKYTWISGPSQAPLQSSPSLSYAYDELKKLLSTPPLEELKGKDMESEIQAKLRQRHADREVERRLRIMEDYGPDHPPGTVFLCEKQFEEDGESYTFVFLRTKKGWYSSGEKTNLNGQSWDDVRYWLVSRIAVSKIYFLEKGLEIKVKV